ncbi:MAG: helix-hairpin-helix domain-containing protein [Candidatus Hodarchaeota archaeon]
MIKHDKSTLSQNDAISIIESLETGLPPEARYLPYIFTGREEILVSLLKGLQQVTNQYQRMAFEFVEGTRGRGKTFLAKLVIELIRRGQSSLKDTIPVYLNLKEAQGSTDFIQDLFYSLIIGLSQNVVIEDKLKIHLRMIINEFSMDLNLYRLRPQDTSLPFRQIQVLLDIVADQDMSVVLFLDELDTITVDINKTNQIFEILGVAYDTPRVRLGWIFLGSRSSITAFKERIAGGCQFASRVFQSEERHLRLSLGPFPDKGKTDLINKINFIFHKAKANPSLPKLNSTYVKALELAMKSLTNPRDITGYIVSKLYALELLTPIIQKSARTLYPSLKQGLALDRELKEKVLPFLGAVIHGIKYRKNTCEYPSIRNLNQNRRIDGELEFEDGYLRGLEIKYSDKSAALSLDNLDQMVAYIKGQEKQNKEVGGIFFLFGKFSTEDPLDTEGKEWLKRLDLIDRINFFTVSNRLFLNEIRNLVNGVQVVNDKDALKGVCSWLITFLGCELPLRKLADKHLDKTPPPKGIMPTVPISVPPVQSLPKSPVKSTKRSQITAGMKEIKLKPGVIKGLGKIRIERLNKEGIKNVQELIRYSKDEIARITGAKPGKASNWLEDAQRLLV